MDIHHTNLNTTPRHCRACHIGPMHLDSFGQQNGVGKFLNYHNTIQYHLIFNHDHK